MSRTRKGLFKVTGSRNYYHNVKDPVTGKWKMRSLRTDDYWMACSRQDAEKGGEPRALFDSVPTLGEFREIYLGSLTANGRRPRTIKSASQSLNKLEVVFGTKRLSEITLLDVGVFKSQRRKDGMSASTISKELRTLRALFGYAVELSLLPALPFKIKKLPEEGNREKATFTPEEIERVLRRAQSPKLRMFLRLAAATGMRRDELLWLTWEDVRSFKDDDGKIVVGEVIVQGKKDGDVEWVAKGRKVRHVPIGKSTLLALREHQLSLPKDCRWVFPGRGVNRWKNPSKSIKRAFQLAGLYERGKLTHAFRHSAATRLLETGMDLENVRDILGHSHVTVTQVYLHKNRGLQREGIERAGLDDFSGEKFTRPFTRVSELPVLVKK